MTRSSLTATSRKGIQYLKSDTVWKGSSVIEKLLLLLTTLPIASVRCELVSYDNGKRQSICRADDCGLKYHIGVYETATQAALRNRKKGKGSFTVLIS